MWRDLDWDPDKDRRNQAKHGVPFDEARTVVHDPLRRVEHDDQHSLDEIRLRITGATS